MRTLTPLAITVTLALLTASGRAQVPADDFDWLAGRWCGGEGSEQVEEQWLAPAGGQMLGVSRTLKGGRMASFEFLRIVDKGGVPTYMAQPGGRPPTEFARTAGGNDWVRFENPAHDFPTRIEYRRIGEALQAHVSGAGGDGKEAGFALDYVRCAR